MAVNAGILHCHLTKLLLAKLSPQLYGKVVVEAELTFERDTELLLD